MLSADHFLMWICCSIADTLQDIFIKQGNIKAQSTC